MVNTSHHQPSKIVYTNFIHTDLQFSGNIDGDMNKNVWRSEVSFRNSESKFRIVVSERRENTNTELVYFTETKPDKHSSLVSSVEFLAEGWGWYRATMTSSKWSSDTHKYNSQLHFLDLTLCVKASIPQTSSIK